MTTISSSGSLSIGYKGKMFGQPRCNYQLVHVIPDGESKEETALLVAAFKKLFTAGFSKLAKKRAKDIKSAMEGTEKDIAKKPPANMDVFVSTANKMIQQGVDVWRNVEVPKLADECIGKVYIYMEKKLKRTVNRKKIRTVLKIVALVLIVVVVAGVSIAGTVLTGGVLAIVVGTAIFTGLGALVKSAKLIDKEYKKYQDFLGKITVDTVAIQKAIDLQEKITGKKEWRKLKPTEKAKLLMNGTKTHVKSLKKHLIAAEGRMILLRNENLQLVSDAAEAEKNWDKMTNIGDAGLSADAKAAKALAAQTKYKAGKFAKKKANFDTLKATAEGQLAMLAKMGEFSGEKVTGLTKFARDNEGTVTFLVAAIKGLVKSGKTIKKALDNK